MICSTESNTHGLSVPQGLRITPDPDNPTDISYSDHSAFSKVTLKYNLTLTGTMPENGVIGFTWKRVRGPVPDEYCQATLSLSGIGNWDKMYVSEGYPFKSDPNDPDLIIPDISRFSGLPTVVIDGSDENPTLGGMLGCNVSGTLKSFIEFYDADGLTFSNGSTGSDLLTLPITVNKPSAFDYYNTWLTSMTGVSNHDRNMTTDASGYDEKKNSRWDLIDGTDTGMVEDYDTLKKTAAEVFGDDPHQYKVNAYLALYDPNVPIGYMRGAMPVGYGE